MHFIKNKSFKTKNEPRELSEVYSKVGRERRLGIQNWWGQILLLWTHSYNLQDAPSGLKF